jgi:murein DD-endopeptidase MepM/ murein hydrolase activator NlpD
VRALTAFAALVAVVVVPSAVAAPAPAPPAQASARALAVRVVFPDGREDVLADAEAPPARLAESGGLEYGDGVIVTGAVWSRARAVADARGTARAGATLRTVSLFDGEIAVGAISTRAAADASRRRTRGALVGSWLAGVTIFGEPVRATPNARVVLADWGYVVLLEESIVREQQGRVGRRISVSALHVHLTVEHGGLPAGTDIFVGYAEAAASVPREQAIQAPPSDEPTGAPIAPPQGPPRDPKPQPPGSQADDPPPVVENPPADVRPDLTPERHVFPVYGPSTFTDDFGAARAVTGWHHGNDIFAPAGAPVLAVTDGTLFLVGWNDVGGLRLWLRDGEGNEFYYAHLSAFSPLAYEGSRVTAGDVIGFVGATGDAVGTPPHLHFEIHPAALLALGYDGVVNPFAYLLAWRRIADASYDWGEPAAGLAPAPGLVLLQADDISSASGLDAEGLAAIMELPAFVGEGAEPVAGEAG